MNREDIIRMAREAKQYAEYVTPQGMEWFDIYNERFAALVASAEREQLTDAAMKAAEKAVDVAIALEREACAKVCENKNTLLEWPTYAAAIRARGQA